MAVRLSADVPDVGPRLAAGAEHGRLTAVSGEGRRVDAVLRTGGALEPPSIWNCLMLRC